MLPAKYFGGGTLQRVLVGSAMGGISSATDSGDFAQGAFQGAWTSVFAFIFNDQGEKLEVWVEKKISEW